jgi:DNA (cytosine-5)-methyltransferase 1
MKNIYSVMDKLKPSVKLKPSRKFRTLDLFCGCGGMGTGLKQAGLDIVAGIDIWDCAINTYKQNHTHLAICKDLTKYTPEEFDHEHNHGCPIDIITGGVPCQSFSIAGKRDPNDPRSSLFMDFMKYLGYFNPKAFVIENVMGILSAKLADGGLVIDIIKTYLGNYNFAIMKLYASDFEVAQNRRRVIILGIRKDLNIQPTEPPIHIPRPAVGSLLLDRSIVPQKYYLSQRALDGIATKRAKARANGNGFGAQFIDVTKPCYTIPARYWKDGYDALVEYEDKTVRRLTEIELAKIQSFPDDYKFSGSKKDIIIQIGNAVACRFAYHLGKHIITLLTNN